MKPAGTITAVPNPIRTTDPAGVGVATLSWSFEGADVVEVRVGAPDGPLLSRSTAAQSTTTGKWVTDGTVFYLQDVSGGAPLSPEHTLASVSVQVLYPAAGMSPSVLILMYHRIVRASLDPWSLCVKPENFAEHLAVLRDRAKVLPLGELVVRLEEGRLPERSVVITFDDGYADNFCAAKPLLERFDIPATFFVTSGYAGQDREFWWDELEQLTLRGEPDRMALYLRLHQMLQPLGEPERRSLLGQMWGWAGVRPETRSSHRPLSLNELATLGHSELIEIGAHTLTHSLLTGLSEAEQGREILAGKVRLEEVLGRSVSHFAYPFGRYDETSLDIVKRGGFSCACATIPGGVDLFSDPFQLPRRAVEDWNGEEFSKRLSSWFQPDRRRPSGIFTASGFASPNAGQRGEGLDGTPEALAKRLHHAEDVRREAQAGLRAFQNQFDSEVKSFRSQRAWWMMLVCRKAYTLLVKNRSVRTFLRWLIRLPWETVEDLAPYELAFPSVDSYVPPLLASPFLPDTDGPSALPKAGREMARQIKYDLLILPVFEFDFRFQRPQQLALHFAKNGHRVFWISPSRRLPDSSAGAFDAVPLRDNLWEIHLRGPRRDIYQGELSDADAGTLLESLEELYREWAVAASAVMIELPFWRALAFGLRKRFGAPVVFDCMDDWESMPDISDFNRCEERRLVGECDLLVLTARQLADKYGPRARRSVLVRNAVDFDLFTAAVDRDDPLAGLQRPVVGYVGAIASWFDYDLMNEVVRSRPQYSFVLIGALGLEKDVIGERVGNLRKFPNVHLLGHRSYAELPAFVSRFDACVIPFVINQVTRATDPVKVYEYLSHGKPVVATAMAELAGRSDLLYIAGSAADFAVQLDRAVSENDEALKLRRVAYASQNTWARRAETIDAEVIELFPLVSILIVTYNSREYVGPCLDSIRRNTSYPNYEVTIVDNGSTDGTVESIQELARSEPRLSVICLPENRGFSAANNIAARQAGGGYLIFLNVDTMASPGWIERLVRHVKLDPSIGVVVPATNSAGNEAKINIDYTDAREMEEFALSLASRNMNQSLEITVAPLFCALVPRTVWDKAGELDERFEIGMFEDDDFSLRVRRLQYRVVVAEDCFVHHFGSASFSKLAPARYQQIFDVNLERFESKWGIQWTPHRYRPETRPEQVAFDPLTFSQGIEMGGI